MYLDQARQLAERMIALHLPGQGWRFCWDNAKKRAGCCKFGPRVITLSKFFTQMNHEARVMDTILHEIAHALAGPTANHGPVFMDQCRRVGAQPRSCYDPATTNMPKGRYQAKCPNCSREFHYHKRPRGQGYFCKKCGPERGQVTFRQV